MDRRLAGSPALAVTVTFVGGIRAVDSLPPVWKNAALTDGDEAP